MKNNYFSKIIFVVAGIIVILLIAIIGIGIGIALPNVININDLSIDEYSLLPEENSFYAKLKYISPDSAIGFSNYTYYIDGEVLHIKVYKGLSLAPIFPRYNSMKISIDDKKLSLVKEIVFDCKDDLFIKIQL